MLVVAGGAILLALPRAVAPEQVPRPRIDYDALSATIAADDELAALAQTQTLSVETRSVGKAYRTYNEVVARQDVEQLAAVRHSVAREAKKAMESGPDELLRLRAYQTRRFVTELRNWERTGQTSGELLALSGDFVDVIRRNDWCRLRPNGGKLALDDAVLRVLFKKRWNDIVGLSTPELELSLDEERVRHSFLIEHPFRSRADARHGSADPQAEKQRLQSVDRLSERDPAYPGMLARGIVHFQSGSYAPAVAAFRAYLAETPDSPHALRAQNYLKAALDRVNETGAM